MDNFKAAIMDMDGTLLNSYEAWERSFCVTLKAQGIAISKEEFVEIYKMTDEQTLCFLANKIKNLQLNISTEQTYKLILDSMALEYENHVQAKDGAVSFVQHLHEKGVSICVATLTQNNLAHAALTRVGIMPYINFIITGDEVGKSKQFPDIFLQASERLGFNVSQTAVFEDSLTAAKTASKAGFIVYGVYDEHQSYPFDEIKLYAHKTILSWTDNL